MMQTMSLIAVGATLALAQNNPPPAPVLLTTTKSAVLPTLPTPFNGVLTLEGAIIDKGPIVPGLQGLLGPAAVQSNLPAASYVAFLPAVAFDALTGTTIRGTVRGETKQGATGVTFTVSLTGLPSQAQYGPLAYHIHNSPVPASGNCTETLAHFDVTNRGEYHPCDTTSPQTCQTGDLSGKHGKITTNGTFSASYVDDYLSTDPASPYFFGAKSITIHTSNTTRLTCANFVLANGASGSSNATGVNSTSGSGSAGSGTGTGTGAPSGSGSSSGAASSSSHKPVPYTGSASKVAAGSAVAGLAAFFALLI